MKIIPYEESKHKKWLDDEKLFGYVRGDIDSHGQMWTAFVPRREVSDYSDERKALNDFTAWFVDLPCMDSVASLYEFCKQYPAARVGKEEDKSFQFFAKDEISAYLVYVICIEKTVNFYINAYKQIPN